MKIEYVFSLFKIRLQFTTRKHERWRAEQTHREIEDKNQKLNLYGNERRERAEAKLHESFNLRIINISFSALLFLFFIFSDLEYAVLLTLVMMMSSLVPLARDSSPCEQLEFSAEFSVKFPLVFPRLILRESVGVEDKLNCCVDLPLTLIWDETSVGLLCCCFHNTSAMSTCHLFTNRNISSRNDIPSVVHSLAYYDVKRHCSDCVWYTTANSRAGKLKHV